MYFNIHTFSIIIHAFSGIIAFIVGTVLLFQTDVHRKLQLGKILLFFLTLLEIFLIIATTSHWQSLQTITQVTFGGLAGL